MAGDPGKKNYRIILKVATVTNTGGDLTMSRRGALKAGGLLGLLGAGIGTASADPTGQVGTEGRPLETLYADTLDGPITGAGAIDSLVGEGLTVTGGTLSVAVDLPTLSVTSFGIDDTDFDTSFPVGGTVAETVGLKAEDVRVTLQGYNPQAATYRVQFRQHDLWPDYEGSPKDTAIVDVYENWLEPTAGDTA